MSVNVRIPSPLRGLTNNLDIVAMDAGTLGECIDGLEAATNAARALGIFGSPFFVVNGELFWGDDRLEDAIAWARNKAPLQGRD